MTNTWIVAAPVTTWLFVTAMPDGSMMKPLPAPALLVCPISGSRIVPSVSMRITAPAASSTDVIALPALASVVSEPSVLLRRDGGARRALVVVAAAEHDNAADDERDDRDDRADDDPDLLAAATTAT